MVKALKTVVVALAACGLALSATSASAQINERVLRFASSNVEGNPQVDGLVKFADLVKEKSGGPSNAADKAVKQLEPPRTIDKPGKYMNEVEFWDIIDLLNWDEEGNDDAVIEPLVSFLSMKKEEEICAFQEILCRKLYDIDGEAYAREIGKDAYQDQDHHFSRDWFLAARACAVANGQGFYEEILQDPSLMPKDLGFAALTAVAGRAFRKKTGKPLSYVPRFSEQSMSNLDLWPSLS